MTFPTVTVQGETPAVLALKQLDKSSSAPRTWQSTTR
jgi:hypothetical protein